MGEGTEDWRENGIGGGVYPGKNASMGSVTGPGFLKQEQPGMVKERGVVVVGEEGPPCWTRPEDQRHTTRAIRHVDVCFLLGVGSRLITVPKAL